jgi:hypothetical protein
MSEELSQAEAEILMVMEKHRADEEHYDFPGTGGNLIIELVSADRRERFFLDVSRGRIDLAKGKYQERARMVSVLARLDFGGAPHRNPDDEEIACPHLHLYREGFGDKWAFPLPKENFGAPADRWRTYQDFLRLCNITQPPHVERGLFP